MTEATLATLEHAAKEPYRVNYIGRGKGSPVPRSGASPAYKAIVLELIAEVRKLRHERDGTTHS